MAHRLTPLWCALLCVLSGPLGCDCGEEAPVGDGSCESEADCADDEVCVDSVCRGPGDDDDPPMAGDCIDNDGDGRGEGCPVGPDCDDTSRMRGGPEVCDEVDNDCDGDTDEEYAAVCFECTPLCSLRDEPGEDGWMPDEENSEGVIVDDGGALTLGRTEATSFAVWVANTGDGTVSKLDSRTNQEIARYPTVGSMAPDGAAAWNVGCGGGGNCPSRTAVDQNFDAYVANRAFDRQGTVSKYANREDDCVDRNANGVIDTSRDLNGDGNIDPNPGAGEFVGVDDECILWTAPVGPNNGVPRALAVGLAPPDALVGDVWVGLFQSQQACRLDAATGEDAGCVPLTGAGEFRPYGAAADASDRIWMVHRGSGGTLLGFVDSTAMTWTTVSDVPGDFSGQSYGVTVDAEGRVYVADDGGGLARYEVDGPDPTMGTWTHIDLPSGTPRGVAADEASLWIGVSHVDRRFGGGDDNKVFRYRLSDLAYQETLTIPTGKRPVGVGVSFDGSVWAICQANNIAARYDPAAGTWTEHGVGNTPYTYSDFIGFGLNVFAEPRGRYRFREEGCETGVSRWQGIEVPTELPPMTTVEIWARTADTLEELDAVDFMGPYPGNPANFMADPPGALPPGRFIEVELRLRTEDRTAAPRVFPDVSLAVVCEPIID